MAMLKEVRALVAVAAGVAIFERHCRIGQLTELVCGLFKLPGTRLRRLNGFGFWMDRIDSKEFKFLVFNGLDHFAITIFAIIPNSIILSILRLTLREFTGPCSD